MTSLMSLMQAAVQPMATGPSPSPTPTPSGGVGFTPQEIAAIIAGIGSGSGSGSTSVPTAPTRARNAIIGTPSVDNPLVFWGGKPRKSVLSGEPAATGEGHGSVSVQSGGDHQLTIEQALNQIFTWNAAKVKEMTDKLTGAGFKITSFDDLKNAWQSVVSRASGMYSVSNGKNKVTPDDVIAMSTAENGALGGGSGSSSTVTSRNKTISTITNGDGWNALQNALSRMLGRDPTESEVRDFVGRMNHLAASHPSITTSTTTGVGTPQQNTTSTQTQAGFNANDVLQNAYQDAQANPDYAESQAGTTYFNATLSALGQIGA